MKQLIEALSTLVHCKDPVNDSHWGQSTPSYPCVHLCEHNGRCRNGFAFMLILKQALKKILLKILKAVLGIPQQTNIFNGWIINKLQEYKVWEMMHNSIGRLFGELSKKWNDTFITGSFINSLRAGAILHIFAPFPVSRQ